MSTLGLSVGGVEVWTEFRPFGLWHLIVVGVCFGLMAGVPVWARGLSEAGERRLRLVLAWSTIVWQVLINSWWLFLSPEGAGDPLPLHVCDIAAIVAGVSLLERLAGVQWMKTLLYFWGIALSSQAFFTPVLEKGMSSPAFWSFWVGHTQIVGIAVYHVVVGGYRPRGRDLRWVSVFSLVYLAVVTPMNVLMETNYGYVGPSKPDKPTIIDALGAWPLRIVWLWMIGQGAMTAAWLPWAMRSWRARPAAVGG